MLFSNVHDSLKKIVCVVCSHIAYRFGCVLLPMRTEKKNRIILLTGIYFDTEIKLIIPLGVQPVLMTHFRYKAIDPPAISSIKWLYTNNMNI